MTTTKRLFLPLARRGNLGKSTSTSIIAQWLDHHSIDWRGFDLDSDHQSFSRLFPGAVQLIPVGEEQEGDSMAALRRCGESAVTVIDLRAHLSDAVLRTLEMLKFAESFAEMGGRITVGLFPMDDLEVMTDLDTIVERLGDSVDYLVIKNRARASRTRMFDGSEIEAELTRLGAQELELPALLSVARNHIAAHETYQQRGITHAEAVANRDLAVDPLIRLAIQDWLRRLFRRLDALAARLLPVSLAENIIARQDAARSIVLRGRRINTLKL